MRMPEKCYDNKMAKLPGDSLNRNFHMRLAKKNDTIMDPLMFIGYYPMALPKCHRCPHETGQ